jgi:hypothetical protein
LGSQLSYFSYLPSLLRWPGWTGFYDYATNELLEKTDESLLFNKLATHWRETHRYLLFPEIAFVSDFPKKIDLDQEYRLNNLTGPALLYRDSYALYFISGVRMTGEEWVCTTPADELNVEKVMAIKNAEQRLMAIKKMGIERVLNKLDSKVISEGNLDSTNLVYKLHEVVLNRSREKLFEMRNPSEPKTHYEWVAPECETVQQADMWRRGFDFKTNYQPTVSRA